MGALERTSLAERAAEVLQRRIATGEYPSGEKLPTEKELAAELGVTRLTLREALSRLAARGWVVTRHGSGTRVCALDEGGSLERLGELLAAGLRLDRTHLRSLMQFRALVFGAFAPAMVEGVTDEHLGELSAILERIEAAPRRPAARAELDHAFDAALARATGNTILVLLMGSLRELHVRLGAAVHRAHGDDAEILETQRALVQALAAGKATKALRVLDRYLHGASAALERAGALG